MRLVRPARVLTAVLAFVLAFAMTMPAMAAPGLGSGSSSLQASESFGSQRWLIEFENAPLAATGASLSSSSAVSYQMQLQAEHDAFLQTAASLGAAVQVNSSFTTLFNGLAVSASAADAASLAALPGVKAVWPDLEVERPVATAETVPLMEYTIDQINAGPAHAEGYTGDGIFVAVMDTGIDYMHPDLGGGFGSGYKVSKGWDFVGDRFCPNDEDTCGVGGVFPDPEPDDDPMDQNGHGTHVAGTIAGKAADEGGITGVAPDAELGAYKVFGPAGSTFSSIMLEAMEMILEDGADVLNMSVGASYAWPNYPTAQASDLLVANGVSVVASIGNNGDTGIFSSGAPGNASRVIGVASADSIGPIVMDKAVLEDTDVEFAYRQMEYSADATGISGTLVALTGAAMLGCELSDYDGYDVDGKVAMVQRGECPFSEKAINAGDAGAIAVIVYNNEPGMVNGTMGGPGDFIPAVGATQADGAMLLELLSDSDDDFVVTFTDGDIEEDNPNAGFISAFSSWGLTPDHQFKPDLTGPGGNVRSTYPLEMGGYAYLSGTSMSSPHVAGAAAVLLGARPDLKADEVREVLMNTSHPFALGLAPAYWDAVHRQGAGMIDVYNAVKTTSRITPEKINMGVFDAGTQQKTFIITLVNDSAEDVTYTIAESKGAITDFNVMQPGLFAYGAVWPYDIEFPDSVTVHAGGRVNVPITVDASLFDQVIGDPSDPSGDEARIFGGWLLFTPDGDEANNLTVPLVGFYGDPTSRTVFGNDAYAPGLVPIAFYVDGDDNDLPGTVLDPDAGDYMEILFNIGIQAEFLRFSAYTADGDYVGLVLEEEYFGRSPDPTHLYGLTWRNAALDDGTLLGDGDYLLRFEVLRPGGSEDQIEYRDFPFTVVGRPPTLELDVTEPVDGFITDQETVTVKGTALLGTEAAEVTVNGEDVEVEDDGSFEHRVLLDEGSNTITIEAVYDDETVTVEREVIADWTAPVITGVEPAEDVTLEWGETTTVRIVANEPVTAAFTVNVPTTSGFNSIEPAAVPGIPMEHVGDGVYEGVYEAPAGQVFEGATVDIIARDLAGNTTEATAAGTITVVAADEDPDPDPDPDPGIPEYPKLPPVDPVPPVDPDPEDPPVEPEDPECVAPFTDMGGHWGEDDVAEAFCEGLVNGFPDGTFRPDIDVTRVQFAAIVVRAMGLSGEGAELPFVDNDDIPEWALNEMALGVEAGIIEGYDDGTFRPEDIVSRSEMAAMIARALGLPLDYEATGFSDNDEVPEWAIPYVAAVEDAGLMIGRGDNEFVPNASATRAEAAVLLLRTKYYLDDSGNGDDDDNDE